MHCRSELQQNTTSHSVKEFKERMEVYEEYLSTFNKEFKEAD
jgi:hypothetical protein